jgi:hypothetical protein
VKNREESVWKGLIVFDFECDATETEVENLCAAGRGFA